jgi:hypothetical protein
MSALIPNLYPAVSQIGALKMPVPALVAAAPAIATGIQALFGLFGAKSANRPNDAAARYAANASNYAADLQAKANAYGYGGE